MGRPVASPAGHRRLGTGDSTNGWTVARGGAIKCRSDPSPPLRVRVWNAGACRRTSARKGSSLEALSEAQAVRELIARCLAGDSEAARSFQETYGELIYG